MDAFLKKSSRGRSRIINSAVVKVIGWGTKSYFEAVFGKFNCDLAYLVDNEESRVGIKLHGIDVRSTRELFAEDPEKTFVIIYSSFSSEIGKQLESRGFFNYESAGLVFAFDRFNALENRLLSIFKNRPSSVRNEHGIVIQGPIVPECTEFVVKSYRHIFSNARIVLSTWENTERELLAPCVEFVDDLVLSKMPENCGSHNRNCQIVSTNAGLQKLSGHNLRYVMKTRTDMFVFNENIFHLIDDLNKFDRSALRQVGMSGRIFVPSSFTRKHLFYHPSDLVVIGCQSDMERYWSIDLDDMCSTNLESLSFENNVSVSMAKGAAESYICQKFLEKCGISVDFTLENSNNIYRDYFCILDNEQLDIEWIKNMSLVECANCVGSVLECVTHSQWLAMQSATSVA